MNKVLKVCIGLVAIGLILLFCLFWNRQADFHTREKFYDALILKAAERHNVRPTLIKALINRESKFIASARGSVGEYGLMQIRSMVADDWTRAQKQDSFGNPDQLLNPEVNIEVGTWYLSKALKKWKDYKECDILALAQYNAGGGTVLKKKWAPRHKDGSALELISFPGTKAYIIAILEFEKEYQNSEFKK